MKSMPPPFIDFSLTYFHLHINTIFRITFNDFYTFNTVCPPDTPVSITTLENVLFMDVYNDIAFKIGEKLIVLVEHQSSINPNMALRLLMYIADTYKRIIKRKTLYSKYSVSIPWPEFYVLYNGTDPYPDNSIVKLSDLFEEPQYLGVPENFHPLLELEIKVININEGKNDTIVNRCKVLSDYSAFIAKVRFFLKETGDLKEAIEKAIIYAQNNDILKEFLETRSTEVINMLYTEWNWDDAKEVWCEEAREEGIELGLAEGRIEEKLSIASNLLAKGLTPEFVHEITGLSLEEIAKL